MWMWLGFCGGPCDRGARTLGVLGERVVDAFVGGGGGEGGKRRASGSSWTWNRGCEDAGAGN